MDIDWKKVLKGVIILLSIYVGLEWQAQPNKPQIHYHIIVLTKDTTKMPDFLETIGSMLFGTGMGIVGQKYSQEQDYQNLLRLMREQQTMGKETALFNQGLALDTWEKTNYPAQVEQMRKAGLNPGLMYKGAGGGGGTLGGGMGMVQPSTSAPPKMDAGMALQMGLNTARAKAEIDNINADTALKQKQAPQVEAQTELIRANTGNAHLDGILKQLDSNLKRYQLDVNLATKPDAIATIKADAQSAATAADTAAINNQILKDTRDQVVDQVRLATTEAALRIELQKANLWKTGQEIKNIDANTREIAARITNMVTQRQQEWVSLDLQAQEVAVKQFMAELQKQQILFNTSTPEQIKQWIGAIMGGANVAGSIGRRPAK